MTDRSSQSSTSSPSQLELSAWADEFVCLPGFDGIQLNLLRNEGRSGDELRLHIRKRIMEEITRDQVATVTRSSPQRQSEGALLDLQKRPMWPDVQISISHTSHVSGWITTRNKLNEFTIGVDLEHAARLKPEVINRISSPTERQLFSSTDLRAIWSCKESAFKAFSSLTGSKSDVTATVAVNSTVTDGLGPQTISQIEITQFISSDKDQTIATAGAGGSDADALVAPRSAFRFEAKFGNLIGFGWIQQQFGIFLSIFLSHPA